MSRRVGLLLAAVIATVMSSSVHADEGRADTTEAQSDELTGELTAVAGREASGGAAAAGAAVSRPRCTWEKFDLGLTGIPGSGVGPVVRDAATKTLAAAPAPTTETLFRRLCPGQTPAYVWVSDGVNEDDLMASAWQQVTAQLPRPAMNMNPDPSVGGIVNIGLWLAVVDPGQVSITASVGPVWATVTAHYQRTVWEMGNGDWVECEGLGTPIVDWDIVEQGPCGYTYRWPSAPKFTGTDDLAYHAAVTGHWVLRYAMSSGRNGSLAPIARTTEFTYQVREIQTLRVAEDG